MMPRNLLSVFIAVITVWAIHAGDFSGSVPRFRQESGGELFDTKIARSSEEVFERIDGFGACGRAEYMFRNVTTDIVLPLSVLPMLVLCTRQWRDRRRSPKLRLALGAAPFIYVFFDLVENFVVYFLIAQHPDANEALAHILPWLTIVKRIGAFTSLAILAASTVSWVRNRFNKVRPDQRHSF